MSSWPVGGAGYFRGPTLRSSERSRSSAGGLLRAAQGCRRDLPRSDVGDKGRRGREGSTGDDGESCARSSRGGGERSLAVLVPGEEDLSECETGRRLNVLMAAGLGFGSKDENRKDQR